MSRIDQYPVECIANFSEDGTSVRVGNDWTTITIPYQDLESWSLKLLAIRLSALDQLEDES